MQMNLDLLTDVVAQVALDKHLGTIDIPLPPPEVIQEAMAEACERLMQAIWESDEEE